MNMNMQPPKAKSSLVIPKHDHLVSRVWYALHTLMSRLELLWMHSQCKIMMECPINQLGWTKPRATWAWAHFQLPTIFINVAIIVILLIPIPAIIHPLNRGCWNEREGQQGPSDPFLYSQTLLIRGHFNTHIQLYTNTSTLIQLYTYTSTL